MSPVLPYHWFATGCLALIVLGQGSLHGQEDGIAFFESKIRPILIAECQSCHSQDAAQERQLKGRLLLDSKAGILAGGESGAAIVPGHPDQSLLIEAMRHESLEMPPGKRLPDVVIADFEKWIAMGAPDPRDEAATDLRALDLKAGREHWAFRPLPMRAAIETPSTQDDPWIQNPVDRFVLAQLEKRSMKPSKMADRNTLIRRAYLDLVGLPPPPEVVDQFVQDPSQTAYEDLVDRLLDSPHYGERWGRHWLDVARFGESEGSSLQHNALRSDAWTYRDAVIKAFNEDLPYTEFVALQVAGQSLHSSRSLAASDSESSFTKELAAFPELGTTLQDNANPNDKLMHRLDDMVATTGSAFLGLTIGCARCHDHKIDPITSEEYYRLTAIYFDQVEVPPSANPEIVLEITEPQLLAGGSWQRPVKKVTPGFVSVLMPKQANSEAWISTEETQSDPKLGLARWLTDVESGAGGLLARVLVNRVWQHHFGRGIVNTPNDFGLLGDEPTHPELLDWLAREFVEGGWKIKDLHRTIMTSATYQQSSGDRASAQRWSKLDADNKLLWHFQPRRLEAETIRDSLLAVSGGLKNEMYGPSVRVGSIERRKSFDDNPSTWRRSIYMMAPRFDKHPTLSIFDGADNMESVGKRGASTTPTGALFMLNAGFVWQQAELLAGRIQKEVGEEPTKQIQHLYRLTFARKPSNSELELGLEFLTTDHSTSSDREGKSRLVHYCHAIVGLNEFIYTP